MALQLNTIELNLNLNGIKGLPHRALFMATRRRASLASYWSQFTVYRRRRHRHRHGRLGEGIRIRIITMTTLVTNVAGLLPFLPSSPFSSSLLAYRYRHGVVSEWRGVLMWPCGSHLRLAPALCGATSCCGPLQLESTLFVTRRDSNSSNPLYALHFYSLHAHRRINNSSKQQATNKRCDRSLLCAALHWSVIVAWMVN